MILKITCIRKLLILPASVSHRNNNSPMSSSGFLTWLMYFISLSFHLHQPLSSHFICFTAYVSTQCLGINLHQVPFGWLAFAGTLNLLTHFTHHLSQLYIFVFVNNHIIFHHHHVRQLLLLLTHYTGVRQ